MYSVHDLSEGIPVTNRSLATPSIEMIPNLSQFWQVVIAVETKASLWHPAVKTESRVRLSSNIDLTI